jgi:CDP-glucose 4,6-dehydratase
MISLADFYRGKRVFVSGHTGFKGAWLCEWLLEVGADVTGYSLSVPTDPALFEILGHANRLRDIRGDLRDLPTLKRAIADNKPQLIFHLAAQALVRASYQDPLETLSTNVLGTAHVLEAARDQPGLLALINVTSDKCYENREWSFGYREVDPMGGADPYSASKGCAELVFSAYARSFFNRSATAIASARAGNVIGGGDWAKDRLIPDCVRAWSKNETPILRNPASVRPWQHVLEPLGAYLELGVALCDPKKRASTAGEAFNFGPEHDAFAPVDQVVREFQTHWPSVRHEYLPPNEAAAQPHEAKLLKLSCEKALDTLAWHPTLRFKEALELTARWYRAFYAGSSNMRELSAEQIRSYMASTRERRR